MGMAFGCGTDLPPCVITAAIIHKQEIAGGTDHPVTDHPAKIAAEFRQAIRKDFRFIVTGNNNGKTR
ncbi:hypothetical protein AA18890_1165 [Komagataeibacter europaeus LMG 18890]|nr:hypothetical protein AA18890_1165 [Komagataeibacter europaeus LMG 18890]